MNQSSNTPDVTVDVFPWSPNFATGLPQIDEQHQRLVNIINELAQLTAVAVSIADVESVVQELIDYTDYHFSFEESVWEPYFAQDEQYSEHQRNHGHFLDQVLAMKAKLNDANLTSALEQLLKLLISWLIYHILDKDKRMALTVHAMEAGMKLSEAKNHAADEIEKSRVLTDTIINMYNMLTMRSLQLVRDQGTIRKLNENLQKESEQKFKQQEALIEEAHRIAHLGNWTMNHRTGEMKWSKQIYDIFGWVEGQDVPSYEAALACIPPDDRVLVDQAFQEALTKRQQFQITHRLLVRTGEIKYIRESADTEFDANGPVMTVGNVQDVTKDVLADLKLRETTEKLRRALIGTVEGVSKALEARDPYTAGHQHRVAVIATQIATKMGWDESRIEGLRLGAGIHDIGKISIPVEILTKPIALTPTEYMLIQTHASSGDEILKGIDFPWPIREIVSQHHERVNGSGYPKGLKGEEISLEARIVAVADVYEAMSTHRPYKAAAGRDAAAAELQRGRGVLYDADVVDAFTALFNEGAFDA